MHAFPTHATDLFGVFRARLPWLHGRGAVADPSAARESASFFADDDAGGCVDGARDSPDIASDRPLELAIAPHQSYVGDQSAATFMAIGL